MKREPGSRSNRAIGWIARGLGVPDTRSAFDWCVRLFF